MDIVYASNDAYIPFLGISLFSYFSFLKFWKENHLVLIISPSPGKYFILKYMRGDNMTSPK